MKLEISWKTAIKLGLFFKMGVDIYKCADCWGVDVLDSAMVFLAKKECKPAIWYCNKYQLLPTESKMTHKDTVVGFKCYSEES